MVAQFQDERRNTENSSDPLKIMQGEGEESQQQQQQSALSNQTSPTQVAADDLNDLRRDEAEFHQPQKKSMLQKVKDTAITLICGIKDDGEKGDRHQFEDEEDHDHFRQEEKQHTEGMKEERVEDLNADFNSKAVEGSAVSPKFDAFPTGNLSSDSDVAKEPELTNNGIHSTSPDTNVVAVDYEPGELSSASDHKVPLPVDTERQQQEVATVPSELSAASTPNLQSTEAASTARPYADVQTDTYSDSYMAHQVHDIATPDTPNSATHPVQAEFSQQLPNFTPYDRRTEPPENELYGKDESEKIEYSDPFARGPRVPEGMMKPITEEPAVETVLIQQAAAEDRWFDADDVVAGIPTVKDQNRSPRHPGSEEFGMTEPISKEAEYADEDKVGGTEIYIDADVSDELRDFRAQETKRRTVSSDESIAGDPILKDQNPSVTHAGSDESGLTELKNEKDKLGGEHQSVDEAPYKQDKMAEEENYENSKKAESYGNEIYETDSTENNENSFNLGNDYGEYEVAVQEEAEKRTERQSADESEEEAHEESGKNLTEASSEAEIVASSNHVVDSEKADGQNDDDDGGEKTVEAEEIQEAERN